MGSAASVLKVLNCDTCAKYVLNAARFESECCGCWRVDIQTDLVDVIAEVSDEEIICDSCCSVKLKH